MAKRNRHGSRGLRSNNQLIPVFLKGLLNAALFRTLTPRQRYGMDAPKKPMPAADAPVVTDPETIINPAEETIEKEEMLPAEAAAAINEIEGIKVPKPEAALMQQDGSKSFAVVTGATQGIGKAIAERLLKEGFDLAICARSQEDIHAVREEWLSRYPDATVLAKAADLSDAKDLKTFATSILALKRDIDLLVNNAGLFFPGAIASEPEGQLESMMAVNVYSAYHLTRALLPTMLKKRSGHIFNLCSVASLKAYPNGGSYSISKYALLGFSENLRDELKPHGIKVTALAPGATYSRSWSGSGIPEERLMKVEDIADMVWATYTLSARADVELIVMRPQLGDL